MRVAPRVKPSGRRGSLARFLDEDRARCERSVAPRVAACAAALRHGDLREGTRGLLVDVDEDWYELRHMGMKKLDAIWLDGQMLPWDSAQEHLLAHTMHYGVGAFEGIR